MKRWLACVVLAILMGGCVEYVELKNTSDRIWIMTKDGTVVLRCIDATPDLKPFAGNSKVFCKAAYMYGTVTDVAADVKSSMQGKTVSCAEGKLANGDTSGHCCWPGQAWSGGQGVCVGQPTCPNGWVLNGTNCEKADLHPYGNN